MSYGNNRQNKSELTEEQEIQAKYSKQEYIKQEGFSFKDCTVSGEGAALVKNVVNVYGEIPMERLEKIVLAMVDKRLAKPSDAPSDAKEMANGPCSYTTKDGRVMTGTLVDGCLEGEATEKFPDGRVY